MLNLDTIKKLQHLTDDEDRVCCPLCGRLEDNVEVYQQIERFGVCFHCEDKKLLTIKEAAYLLSLNPETLRRWDNKGTLPAVHVGSRRDRRYRVSDIRNYLER